MKAFILTAISLVIATAQAFAGTIGIVDTGIYNVCINKRVMRINDNVVAAELSGIGLEVSVDIATKNMKGQRLLCIVTPLNDDGSPCTDRYGELTSAVAIDIADNDYSDCLKVPLPGHWLPGQQGQTLTSARLKVTLKSVYDNTPAATKKYSLDQSKIRIDTQNIGRKFMSDIFSSPGMSAGIGSLFYDQTAQMECRSCDGTMICPSCDGYGFIDPRSCRKCSRDPGICRRCKGLGQEMINID